MEEQVSGNETSSMALNVINQSLKLPFVKVNRSEFLVKTFGDVVGDTNRLINDGPQTIFSKKELDVTAQRVINKVVSKSSAISFVTGLPGGPAIAATIPADIAQFYGYSLRLAQEISYVYGYDNIWNEQDELTEEGKNTLMLYLGIMLGVTSAGSVVRVLSSKLSAQALKKIPQKALTKTIYYPIIKKVLAIFGTKLTKSTFAKGISKAVPVIGGLVSGGLNLASMKPMAKRLMNELGKSVNYSEADMRNDFRTLRDNDVEIFDDYDTENKSDIVQESNKSDETEEDDNFSKIEKAYDLLNKNIITQEEFENIKKKILSEI